MPGRDIPLYRPCGDPNLVPDNSTDTNPEVPVQQIPPLLVDLTVIRLQPIPPDDLLPEDERPLHYVNDPQSYTATCPEGYVGDPVTVTVVEGMFGSDISQEDANAKALAAAKAAAEAALECILEVPPDLLLLEDATDVLWPSDAYLYLSGDQQSGADKLGF